MSTPPEDFNAASDYTVTTPEGALLGWMRASFANASDHVLIATPDEDGLEPEWQMTGRQVAAFRHSSEAAAEELFEVNCAVAV